MNRLVRGFRPWHYRDNERLGIEIVDRQHQHRAWFLVDLPAANGPQLNEVDFAARDRQHHGDLQGEDPFQRETASVCQVDSMGSSGSPTAAASIWNSPLLSL